MINRDKHYEDLAEEILSKPTDEKLLFLEKVKERDNNFYERIEKLILLIEKNRQQYAPEIQSQIRKILSEIKR